MIRGSSRCSHSLTRSPARRGAVGFPVLPRKGTNGVSTHGLTADFMFVWQRGLLSTPVNLFLYSQKCQGVPFPQSVKIITFAAARLVLTPFVRPKISETSPKSLRNHPPESQKPSPRDSETNPPESRKPTPQSLGNQPPRVWETENRTLVCGRLFASAGRIPL